MTFKEFKNKYEHKSIEIYPDKTVDNVKVSVCVVTYNHSNYIKQCLDSILNQKTDFSYEILLGDDASTDGTREICTEYATKHPQRIRLFLHCRENNIKIDGRSTGRFNFLYNLYSARGKYIAMCEGDDYWTDSLKLQKQVDFLEKNTMYSFCSTNYHTLKNGNIKEVDLNNLEICKRNVFFKNYQATASLMFKHEVVRSFLNFDTSRYKAGDWLLQCLACVYHGPGKCLNFYSSVYRIHENGLWSSYSTKEMGKAGVELLKQFKKLFRDDESQKLIQKAINNRKTEFKLDSISRLKNILSFNKIFKGSN
jgi:glycosyltransferase involved in cell wall biosynthesis